MPRKKKAEVEQPAPAATTRLSKHRCGYCLTGSHDLCMKSYTWGVTGTTYICPCPCEEGKPDA
jgi:hypothetical protein